MIRVYTIVAIALLAVSSAHASCRTFEDSLAEIEWLSDEFGSGPLVLHPIVSSLQKDPALLVSQILLASQELTDVGKNSSLRAAALNLFVLETLIEDADESAKGLFLGAGGHFVNEYDLPDMEAAEIFRCTLLCREDSLNQCVETEGGP